MNIFYIKFNLQEAKITMASHLDGADLEQKTGELSVVISYGAPSTFRVIVTD